MTSTILLSILTLPLSDFCGMVVFDEYRSLEKCGIHLEAVEPIEGCRHDLCHHSSPGNQVSGTALASSLFKVHDCGKQAVNVLIFGVIPLAKGIEALR
jgi:hypothetical protein